MNEELNSRPRVSPTCSRIWWSCDFTSRASKQRTIAQPYTIPDYETRKLRARLILEEALETINALGFQVQTEAHGPWPPGAFKISDYYVGLSPTFDLEKIIDGCCDTVYVAVGTLWACGVPDIPHMEEVIRANDDKFPGGKGVPHKTVPGKFGKPDGWKSPDHLQFYPEGRK